MHWPILFYIFLKIIKPLLFWLHPYRDLTSPTMVNLHQALTKSLRRVRPAYCSGYVTAWEERVPNRGPPLDKLHPWPNHEWKHEYKCIRWGHLCLGYTPTAQDSTWPPITGNPLNALTHLLGLTHQMTPLMVVPLHTDRRHHPHDDSSFYTPSWMAVGVADIYRHPPGLPTSLTRYLHLHPLPVHRDTWLLHPWTEEYKYQDTRRGASLLFHPPTWTHLPWNLCSGS